jgi:hypothetical protein
MRSVLFSFVWIIAFAGHVAGAEPSQYLCIVDQSTGFQFRDGKWRSVDFIAGSKYIVRRVRLGELDNVSKGATWGVYEHGETYAVAGCREPGENTYGVLGGRLICTGYAKVAISRDTLRFQIVYEGNYVTPARPEGDSDTPSVAIGRCSAL